MNRVIYFLFISMLFLNCENDIDINADWEEIPVIYSILNPGADNDCDGDGVLNLNDEDGCKENYIRIQKYNKWKYCRSGTIDGCSSISNSIKIHISSRSKCIIIFGSTVLIYKPLNET